MADNPKQAVWPGSRDLQGFLLASTKWLTRMKGLNILNQTWLGFELPPTFNAAKSEAAKQAGIDAAANKPSVAPLLAEARAIAVALASGGREITADDVVAELVRRGHDVHCLGNAAGSLFKGKHWEFVRFHKSIREWSHGNRLCVWRLK